MGFNSVMSVGDMPFDFGAYGGLSVKIPEGLSWISLYYKINYTD